MKNPRLLLPLSALGISLLAVSCQHRHPHHGHPHHGHPHHGRTAVVAEPYRPGYVVRALPPRYQTLTYGGNRYYHHNNVYYRPQGRAYVVVEDPRSRATTRPYRSSWGPSGNAAVIRTLPRDYRTVNYRGARYYQHGDTFYQPATGGYRMVASPYSRR